MTRPVTSASCDKSWHTMPFAIYVVNECIKATFHARTTSNLDMKIDSSFLYLICTRNQRPSVFFLNCYESKGELKKGLKTQKMHFCPFFELTSDTLAAR